MSTYNTHMKHHQCKHNYQYCIIQDIQCKDSNLHISCANWIRHQILWFVTIKESISTYYKN